MALVYRINRFVALCCVSIIFAGGPGRAETADRSVVGSITISSTRILSTQTARATLTIQNNTAKAVSFAFASIEFLVRSGSTWEQSPLYRVITRMPPIYVIAPSSSRAVSFSLPSCIVYSDPCAENVIVRFTLNVDGSPQVYQVPVPQYEFVADPTATYDISGLQGNRPVFITEGTASDTFYPDTVLLAVTAAPSEPHPPTSCSGDLVDELREYLRSVGLTTNRATCDFQGDTWRALLYVSNGQSQMPAIRQAASRIRARFGNRVTSITQRYLLDFSGDPQGLLSRAVAVARREAADTALLVRAGDLQASYLQASPRLTFNDPVAGREIFPNATELPFSQYLFSEAPPSRLNVSAAVQTLYAAKMPARLDADPGVRALAIKAFRAPDSWYMPPLEKQATIAADRPELFVFGTASASTALGYGIVPDFAAILHARERSARIAALLGLRLGFNSLFAFYPASEDAATRTVGVATTFLADDPVRLEVPKADPGLHVGRMSDPREEAMLPIRVPDKSTLITEMAQAFISLSASKVNCAKIQERLLKATIRQNMVQAEDDARSSRRRLRALVLLAVFQGDNQTRVCGEGDGTVWAFSSMMVFRTFPPRSGVATPP